MPRCGALHRFSSAIVLVEQGLGPRNTGDAAGEARAVLAGQDLGRWRARRELLRIEVPATSDAVNVGGIVGVPCWILRFSFTFGETLQSFHGGALFSLGLGGCREKSAPESNRGSSI